jgi:hypothetical protein
MSAINQQTQGRRQVEEKARALITSIHLVLYVILLVTVLFLYSRSPTTSPINLALLLLSGVVGSVIGWALGVFLSPFDPAQERYFTPVVKSVSAFVGGYLISYLNKFIDSLFFKDDVLHPTRLMGAGIFLTFLIATWITVFINRFVYERPEEGRGPTTP